MQIKPSRFRGAARNTYGYGFRKKGSDASGRVENIATSLITEIDTDPDPQVPLITEDGNSKLITET